jgi:transglutaminase-like putative cysteine protease
MDVLRRPTRVRAAIDEPALAAWVRPLVYVLAMGAFAYPLAHPTLVLVVAACAGLGAVAGRVLAGSSLRMTALGALTLAGVAAVGFCREIALRTPAIASWLGPTEAVSWIAFSTLGPIVGLLAAWLRAAALRARLFRGVEVAFIALSFAGLVISHRDGAINRPFALTDSIIAAGGDPTVALLAVGALAALLVAVFLLSERRPLRALAHLALALALLGVVFGSTGVILPDPPDPSGLGLRKGKDDEKGGKGGQGAAGGASDGSTDNEELEFRDNYDSQGRLIPLAVVLLHDDYSPPSGLYYFRQTAFSQFNGRRLVSATKAGVDGDVAQTFALAPTRLQAMPATHGERVVLDTTVALLAEHRRPFALESPVEIRPERNPDPGRFRRIYRVTSAALATESESLIGRGVGDPAWSEETRRHYLAMPEDLRYRDLANKIMEHIPEHLRADPVARAFAVSWWLSQEGTYSLKSGHAQAEDPTADFLFGDKVGYCVHFSHAAVYLMRAMGIPARVGAGYAFEEAARQGGSAILLSGANSHAWPEVWIDGVGWVIADVSPERALDPPIAPPDVDLQRLLGEMARGLDPLPQGEELPFAPAARVARELPRALAWGAALTFAFALVFGYTAKAWRRVAPSFAGRSALARVVYRAQLDRLSEAAYFREEGESREAFAARIAEVSPSFAALTRAHVARTFGRDALLERAEARNLARAVRREVKQTASLPRRLLGILHPFSWLGSR